MGGKQYPQTAKQCGGLLGKIDASLNEKLQSVEWGEFKLGDLFESSNGNFDIQKEHINNKGDIVITAGLTNNGILGKTDIEAKIADTKKALEGTDTQAIKTASDALQQKFYEVSAKIYSQANPQGTPGANGADVGGQGAQGGTYDGDYTVVDDENK